MNPPDCYRNQLTLVNRGHSVRSRCFLRPRARQVGRGRLIRNRRFNIRLHFTGLTKATMIAEECAPPAWVQASPWWPALSEGKDILQHTTQCHGGAACDRAGRMAGAAASTALAGRQCRTRPVRALPE